MLLMARMQELRFATWRTNYRHRVSLVWSSGRAVADFSLKARAHMRRYVLAMCIGQQGHRYPDGAGLSGHRMINSLVQTKPPAQHRLGFIASRQIDRNEKVLQQRA
jgi:hypothetical protein